MSQKFVIFSLLLLCFVFSASISAQEIEGNPSAPDNADANLQVGETALAIDKRFQLRKVTILAKENGIYKVVPVGTSAWEIKNRQNTVKSYKANSVFKDFDLAAFNAIALPYQQYVEPYLACFANSVKLPVPAATGKEKWGEYYIKDVKEYDLQIAKLGELWTALQAKFKAMPNTYSPYLSNPIIWSSIAKNRELYVKCLANSPNTESVKWMLKDIANAKMKIDNFNGSGDLYGGSLDWIWRAVSMKSRNEFYTKQTGFADFEALAIKIGNDPKVLKNKVNAELDALKVAVEPKLAKLKMEDSYFKLQDAALQATMKAYLKNPATLKIFKTGVSDSDWQIEKNSLGIPLYRYKRGAMLVKNSADDHNFCKGLFFVVKQTYSGGGTFGKSEVSEYHEELYGCQ